MTFYAPGNNYQVYDAQYVANLIAGTTTDGVARRAFLIWLEVVIPMQLDECQHMFTCETEEGPADCFGMHSSNRFASIQFETQASTDGNSPS